MHVREAAPGRETGEVLSPAAIDRGADLGADPLYLLPIAAALPLSMSLRSWNFDTAQI